MQNKNTHKNHRKRIRERYEKNGADVFEVHQLLEMLLFHSLRQGDTNPIAHRVLEAYPDLSLGTADPYELTGVEGVGKNTANLLSISADTVLAVMLDGLRRGSMDSAFTRMEYMWLWFKNKPGKMAAVLLLDTKNRFLECRPLNVGSSLLPKSYERAIIRALEKYGATSCVLCHNHTNNEKSPSVEDIYLTGYLKKALSEKDFSLLAHYIITGTDCIECPVVEESAVR
ncbi:MAG: hypothetical protein E7647_03025 [Ruminococcaceae bacterium]|nr:hypothetical protein [Oscillospiraceae bacterium]